MKYNAIDTERDVSVYTTDMEGFIEDPVVKKTRITDKLVNYKKRK